MTTVINTTTSIIINTPTYNTTTNLGPNNVSAGNASVTIDPTLYDLTLDANGIVIAGLVFNFASNFIKAGNGQDTVYGTMHDLVLTAENGGIIAGCAFNFGGKYRDNTITVGNGNDTLYGTLYDVTLFAIGADAGGNGSLITANSFNFGSNTLIAGNGVDTMFGTMHNLTLDAFDFNYASGARFTTVGGAYNSGGNTFTFGSMICGQLVGNSLTAGNGSGDVLYGTMQDIMIAAGNLAVVGGFQGGYNTFTYGGNCLVVGNGNNDTLYGTMHDIGTPANPVVAFGAGAVGGFVGGGNNFIFGSNTLIAGNGSYDTLYGTLNSINLVSATQFAVGGFVGGGNSFTFAANTLIVGNGSYDILYGDLKSISIACYNGGDPASVAGTFVSGYDSFTSAGNTLIAGNGNMDQLIGSIGSITLMAGDGGIIGSKYGGSMTFNFGSNLLSAGCGAADQLFGSMQDMTIGGESTHGNIVIGSIQAGGINCTYGTVVNGQLQGNILIAGDGAGDLLYGTMRDLNLSSLGNTHGYSYNDPSIVTIIGGEAQIPGAAAPLTGSLGLSHIFGNNCLRVGDGAGDRLDGSMRNLNLLATNGSLIGGSSFPISADPGLLNPAWGVLFSFGSNSLWAGNGSNDSLYGTLETMTLTASVGAYIGSSGSGFLKILSAGNILTAGNGVGDKLYGSMGVLNETASNNAIDYRQLTASTSTIGQADVTTDNQTPGGGIPTPGDVTKLSNYVQFSFGDNHLTVGNGAGDQLFGNMQQLNVTAINSFIGGYSVNGENFYKFGHNVLTAGNGSHDILCGTMQNLTLDSQNDYRVVNHIWYTPLDANGNPVAVDINNNPTTNLSDPNAAILLPDNTWGISQNYYMSAGNSLVAGDGAGDQLYGTMQNLSLLVPLAPIAGGLDNGGTGTIGAQAFGWNTTNQFYDPKYGPIPDQPTHLLNEFSFGGSSVTAGNGNGDVLVGSVGQVLLSITNSGNTHSTLADILSQSNNAFQSTIGAFGDTSGTNGNVFIFGDDVIHAGCGAGDMLYGSVQDFTLNASGQYNVIGGLGGGFNSFTFGNNILVAGNGAGDQLFGTMHDMVLTAVNGGSIGHVNGDNTAASNPNEVNTNIITMGNNILTAGSGTGDILYGNMHNLVITQDAYIGNQPGAISLIDGNTIQFGTNVLNAGSGGDILVGELNAVVIGAGSASTFNVAQFNANNTIIAGNNTFNLGVGNDTVVLNTAIDAGVNLINNWSRSNDVLEFHNAPSLNTVLAGSTIASDGHGGTTITFATAAGDTHNVNGGSVDFAGVAYHGETVLGWLGLNVPHINVVA